MKYIKLALISFILLFVIATLISFLLPSKVIVSRPIDIKGSPDAIQNKIGDLNQWKDWLSNSDTLPILVHNNKTLQMGDTKVTLIAVSPRHVVTQWQVKQGTRMPGTFNIISHDSSSIVTVQWQFVHQVKWYPWEKFASIVFDKVLGPFMEESLENLKKNIEHR